MPLEEVYRYNMDALLSCLTILYAPSAHIKSIDEDVEPHRDDLFRRVTIEAVFPATDLSAFPIEVSGDEQHLVFPLLTPRKGRLLTLEDLTSSTCETVTKLSHHEHQTVARSMLTERLWQAGAWWMCLEFPGAVESILQIQGRLHDLVTCQPDEAAAIMAELFEEGCLRAFHTSQRPPDEERLYKLAVLMSDRYLVLIELNGFVGDRQSLSYSYRHQYKADPNEEPLGRVKEFLGGVPAHRRFPIPLARRTGDYHFRMSAPDQHYCYSQGAYFHGSRARLPPVKSQLDPPEVISVVESGAVSYAHVYVEDGWNSADRLDAGVTFYELPLGSAGRAWVLSFVTFLISLLLLGMRSVSASFSGVASDIPALLVALTASAAGLVGPIADAGAVPSTALLSRIILFSTTVLGNLFAVWWVLSEDSFSKGVPLRGLALFLKHWGGVGTVVGLLAIVAYASIRSVRNSLRYREQQ